jgi:hypothetical protein
MYNPYKKAMQEVLNYIVHYKSFFIDNPKPLAHMMVFYDNVHYASRYDKNVDLHDWDNPKYPIIELGEKLGSEYGDLFYDAWAYGSFSNEYKGKFLPLQYKINKTMNDWEKIWLNPKFRYHSLYPTRNEVLNHFLCTNGSGYNWNKYGFVFQDGPCGTDVVTFMGSEKAFKYLPKPIQKTIKLYLTDRVVKKGFSAMNRSRKEQEKDSKALSDFCNSDKMIKDLTTKFKKCEDAKSKKAIQSLIHVFQKQKTKKLENIKKHKDDFLFRPMSENYCLLDSMPPNADKSYVNAGIEICNLILSNPKEKKNGDNYKIAKKFLKKWKSV